MHGKRITLAGVFRLVVLEDTGVLIWPGSLSPLRHPWITFDSLKGNLSALFAYVTSLSVPASMAKVSSITPFAVIAVSLGLIIKMVVLAWACTRPWSHLPIYLISGRTPRAFWSDLLGRLSLSLSQREEFAPLEPWRFTDFIRWQEDKSLALRAPFATRF